MGLGVLLVGVLWTGASYAGGDLSAPALVLGLAISFLIAGPMVGAGIYVLRRASREMRHRADARKKRELLGLVKTQGQVSLDALAIELDASGDQVRAWIYDLVDKGLFAGYTDWRTGKLYSREASQLRGTRCPNCGGEVEVAGKGTVACPFCGAEIFLTD
jgi:DNA-directed RNA polymerase subunit RPC12/RpoP